MLQTPPQILRTLKDALVFKDIRQSIIKCLSKAKPHSSELKSFEKNSKISKSKIYNSVKLLLGLKANSSWAVNQNQAFLNGDTKCNLTAHVASCNFPNLGRMKGLQRDKNGTTPNKTTTSQPKTKMFSKNLVCLQRNI